MECGTTLFFGESLTNLPSTKLCAGEAPMYLSDMYFQLHSANQRPVCQHQSANKPMNHLFILPNSRQQSVLVTRLFVPAAAVVVTTTSHA